MPVARSTPLALTAAVLVWLAGMAAAVAATEHGLRVELFERRKQLGGRVGSFRDPRIGTPIDHCQHVAMACCTNLADFCNRTGIDGSFQRHANLHFFGPDAERADFVPAGWLPAVVCNGMNNPVIEVADAESGELVYALRISGRRFQPMVFEAGKKGVSFTWAAISPMAFFTSCGGNSIFTVHSSCALLSPTLKPLVVRLKRGITPSRSSVSLLMGANWSLIISCSVS